MATARRVTQMVRRYPFTLAFAVCYWVGFIALYVFGLGGAQ